MIKLIGLLIPLIALTACDTQPHMSRVTSTGQPCHAVGYSWSPVWVSPDGKSVCW
jgi:hypothetical protein